MSSLICDIVAVRGNTFKYIPPATILKIFRQIVNFWVQNVSVRSSAEIGKMSSVHVEAAAHLWKFTETFQFWSVPNFGFPTNISGWITLDLAFSMEASLCNWTRYVIWLRLSLSLLRSLVYDKDWRWSLTLTGGSARKRGGGRGQGGGAKDWRGARSKTGRRIRWSRLWWWRWQQSVLSTWWVLVCISWTSIGQVNYHKSYLTVSQRWIFLQKLIFMHNP